MVYQSFTASLTISDLAIGDSIRLSTPFSYFYDSNQTNCSTSVATCATSALLTVLAIDNAGTSLTSLAVQLINQAYLGSYSLDVSVYDSLNVYGKQTGTATLGVTTLNQLLVSATQTNPYLNENSVYTFTLNFTTPNATTLLLASSSNFSLITVSCLVNCGVSSSTSAGQLLTLLSNWAVFTV